MLNKEEIEKAKEKLKKFCDYEDNLVLMDNVLYEYQEAIETVLQTLNNHTNSINKLQKEVYKENKKCSLLAIENNDLKENSILKKKIKDKIEEQIAEADEVIVDKEYIGNFNGSNKNQRYYFEGYKDATLFISELLED